MQVTNKTREPDAFKPIVLEITLETLAEVRALYMVCNFAPIIKAQEIRGVLDLSEIRRALGEVKYMEHWEGFSESVKNWYENNQGGNNVKIF